MISILPKGSDVPLIRWTIAIWSALVIAASALVLQPPPGQGEFVPISQLPPGDRLPAAPLLIAAYAFVWVALLVYLWSIWRRLGKVESDLRALEQKARK